MLIVHVQHDADQAFADLIECLQLLPGSLALQPGSDLLCRMDADIGLQQDHHHFLQEVFIDAAEAARQPSQAFSE